jgi:hypothetical protein
MRQRKGMDAHVLRILHACKPCGKVDTHFVPMFLDTTLSAQREGFRDFTPAAASVAQRFQSLFLGWRPRSVGSALLGQRTR